MKILSYSIILGLLLALSIGCSKKKEEAAKMEQEMLAQEAGDSAMKADSAAMMDTMPEPMDAAAVPEEPAEESIETPPPATGGYTVQVASCEDADYARHLQELYFGRGYEPFITTINYEGQTYYRVRVGAYDTYSGAKAAMNELIDRYSINAWIDVI